jgi:hypothetical protein
VRPCVPITIRSQPSSSATLTIVRAGGPVTTRVSALTFSEANPFLILARRRSDSSTSESISSGIVRYEASGSHAPEAIGSSTT